MFGRRLKTFQTSSGRRNNVRATSDVDDVGRWRRRTSATSDVGAVRRRRRLTLPTSDIVADVQIHEEVRLPS